MSNLPTTIGKYQVIREIARSNDIVYEAYDGNMNRRVAVKELAVPHGSTPQQREERIKRFKREVKAAGSLAHPNIVTIYEVGEDSGRHFMAMEFLDGHTLRNEIDTHGFLPPLRSVEIAREVLKGLHYAHAHGVVHRDIKPENVQLLEDGRVKITDFGIARLTFEPNLTIDGQVFGTPSYMSPEQVVGKEIDARSDLFSVGVLIYEMVSGRKPFSGDSVVSISHAIMNVEPAQPQQASYQLWQVIQRAIEKSAVMRFSTAVEMLEALEIVDGTMSSGSVVFDPFPTATQPTVSPYIFGQVIPGPPPVNNQNPFYPPPLQAPTANYAYNPFGPTGSQQPMNYGPPQPFGPVPIYYPPPPRPPLIKPETKRFFGRLMLTLIIMGSLAVLVIVAINTISNVVAENRRQQQDETIRALQDGLSPNASVSSKIRDQEKILPQLKSDMERIKARIALAESYRDEALQYRREGNFVAAEHSLKKARANDPDNPRYYEDLGEFYADRALAEADGLERATQWNESANRFKEAGSLEHSEAKRSTLNLRAATSFLNAAYEFDKKEDPQSARKMLYFALQLSETNPELNRKVREMLDRLSGIR